MDTEIQTLLNSPLAEDRKRGVEMLAQSNDPDTLKVLSALHKRESDAEIKQLIVEVGKGIKRRIDTGGGGVAEPVGQIGDMVNYDFDGKPKRKNEFQQEETTWGTALMDVGLYGILSGAGVFLVALFFIFAMGSILQEIANSPSFNPNGDVGIAQLADTLNSIGLILAVVYGVIMAVFSMASYMIWLGIIHLMARYALSGQGSYTGVLHRAFIPMIVWMIASFVLGVIGGYFSFSALADATAYDQYQTTNVASSLVSVINFAATIGFSLWLSSKIGENYRFGTGKGCASIILSYIVIFVAVCGCIFFFTAVLANSLESAYSGFIPLFF